MIVQTVRSNLIEAVDHVDAVAVDAAGEILDAVGMVDTPLFYRSAVKLLQATVSSEVGGELPPEHLAVACASHGGHPVHIAIVEAILDSAGLDDTDLRCPPSWPLSEQATRRLVAGGASRPRAIWHNCSGKHAAMLRACVAAGFPTESYLDPAHPLQHAMGSLVEDVTGAPSNPAGVDGCGAPAFRGTLTGLARSFARISSEPRFRPVAEATSRFGPLSGDNLRPDGRLGRWWDGPLKVGAMGLIGAGKRGIGLAAKSRSGSAIDAAVGMMEMMRRLDLLTGPALAALAADMRPAVLGGGRPVGEVRPAAG